MAMVFSNCLVVTAKDYKIYVVEICEFWHGNYFYGNYFSPLTILI